MTETPGRLDGRPPPMRAPLFTLLLLLTLPPLAAGAAPFPVTATPAQVVLGRDKAVVVQVKTELSRGAGAPKEEADLKRVTDILRAARFRGYVALEYEGREDAMKAVPRYLGQLKELMRS